MDVTHIRSALDRIYNNEQCRIVFWNDPKCEFEDSLSDLVLDGVTTLRLDEIGSLELKIRIEKLEPDGKFLLYAPFEEPDYDDDWLLDTRLYSRSFRADRASIVLQDLGLLNLNLRGHLDERGKFFDAVERVAKLKSIVSPEDSASDLDRKMITVLVKAEQPDIHDIVNTLFHSWVEISGDTDLDHAPVLWNQVEKFGLDGPFWTMVRNAYGYEEVNPTLKNLLIRLLTSDFAYHLKCEVPASLVGLLLPSASVPNAVVALASWRDSISRVSSYDVLSAEVGRIIDIEKHLNTIEIEHLDLVNTFLDVEKYITTGLKDRIIDTAEVINVDDVLAIANRRQNGHWVSLSKPDSVAVPRQTLYAIYEALIAASRFYDLRNQHLGGFDYPTASEMYSAYESELYQFDQLYRQFCEGADRAESRSWDVLKLLRCDIEDRYSKWYLLELALAWGKFIEQPNGLLNKWGVESVSNQYRFYDHHIRPWLDAGDTRRSFVIISDAFRYEAAQELVSVLNGKYRFAAELSSQLGVLPSYTALGMASLLPHTHLSFAGSDIMVDGKSSIASERNGVLLSVNGIACKYSDLIALKKDEGRALIKDQRVVYIYHDTVDAIGDDGKTEGRTFEAVRTAIDELSAMVNYIVNSLNGSHIVITADHGFMYTESGRVATDKSKLNEKYDNAIVTKKRYVIGPSLPVHEAAWHGTLRTTAGVDSDLEFLIPKGANLFHFVGGARFYHGGAMLQEIVVPIVTVKHIRGKAAEGTRVKTASIHIQGANHRITANRHRFQFIQTEAVSERVKAATVKVAIYCGNEIVSDLQTVKFESASEAISDRTTWVSLVLKDRKYDKRIPCRLIVLDAETGVEQLSVEVIIDRAISNDF
ncbi:MAG: BREX-1 system phosphatase PglZ type A [Ignavibacteria bacterium]|nr:BREX-1 system phosphatase PglZ type A [Ignavibacteria bacterium]